ncbi:hypothetical protein M9458_013183, partial [Cirrhinus mrigala]
SICQLSPEFSRARVQVSQDHPSGLTPVTQAEQEQQNSLPLACSQPAANCNVPSS